MSELEPRQWEEGEEAEWIADKVGILGDYGQDAARVLRRQVSELSALREQLSQLQRKLGEEQEAHAQLQTRCFDGGGSQSVFDRVAELQRQLNQEKIMRENADRIMRKAQEMCGIYSGCDSPIEFAERIIELQRQLDERVE